MPRYFKAWEATVSRYCAKRWPGRRTSEYLSRSQKQTLQGAHAALGLDPEQRNALVMWGTAVATAASRCSTRRRCSLRAILRPTEPTAQATCIPSHFATNAS